MGYDTVLIFIPYITIYLISVAVSWVHIFKHRTYTMGNRAIWLAVTLLVHFVGPILYFTLGKDEV